MGWRSSDPDPSGSGRRSAASYLLLRSSRSIDNSVCRHRRERRNNWRRSREQPTRSRCTGAPSTSSSRFATRRTRLTSQVPRPASSEAHGRSTRSSLGRVISTSSCSGDLTRRVRRAGGSSSRRWRASGDSKRAIARILVELEWLAGVMAELDRRAGVPVLTADDLAGHLDYWIAAHEEGVRAARQNRVVFVQSSTDPTAGASMATEAGSHS